MSSDFQDQMMKFMNKMDQIIDSQNQMVNSHFESIAKIEAHEEELSPIYWPPQQKYHVEPLAPMNSDLQDQLLKFMSKMDHIKILEHEVQLYLFCFLEGVSKLILSIRIIYGLE